MNDERMPINLYKLDSGYNDKGMNGKELIVFAIIVAFVNFKVPDMVMMCLVIYIAALALLVVSLHKIHRYHLQYKSIKEDLAD